MRTALAVVLSGTLWGVVAGLYGVTGAAWATIALSVSWIVFLIATGEDNENA